MYLREKVLSTAIRRALGVMAVSGFMLPAQAQTAPDPAASAPQKVEITGSHIKRADKEGTAPVQIITAKEIRESGATSIQELLQSMPAMGMGGANDMVDGSGSFSKGVSSASMRGMGPASTLILLNGRRMTQAANADINNGKSVLYDLNSIPMSAIERIEILKDGASAVYGSDAIAGVINFITKQDYQGGSVDVSANANGDGKFGKQHLNLTAGTGSFAQDGYNVFASLDISKRDRTLQKEASAWESEQYRAMNGLMNGYYSAVSNQAFFYKEKPASKPGTYSNTFYNSKADGKYVINQLACDPSRIITGGSQYNISSTSVLSGRKFCNYDPSDVIEAQPYAQDISLLSRGSLALNPNLSSFLEFAFTRSDREYTGIPKSLTGTSTTSVAGVSTPVVPFQPILPIGHPDNPFKDARAGVSYRFENKPLTATNINDNIRLLAGLKGNHYNWDWETALLWNRTNRDDQTTGYLYYPTIQQLITQNRSLASIAADPTSTHTVKNTGTADIAQIDAKGTTEFGQLGGGAMGLALGTEFRRERLNLTPDIDLQNGNIIGLANSLYNAQRNVFSTYAELRTPFLKNFEMDFAARYDKYPNYAGSVVPKVGAKWTVNESLALRGTYAHGFRAPALIQVSKGGQQSFSSYTDPIRCPDGKTPVSGASTTDCKKSIWTMIRANPDLEPETAKSITLGLIFSPTSNFDISLDYYHIRKEMETAARSADFILNHAADFPGAIIRDNSPDSWIKDKNGNIIPNSGPLQGVLRDYVNVGATQVSGVDFDFSLRNNLGELGKLTTRLQGTYTIEYRRAENPGDVETNLVGTAGGISNWAVSLGNIPRLKTNLSTRLEKGPHVFRAAVNFIDGVSYLRRTDNDVTYPTPYCHYGPAFPGGTAQATNSKYLSYQPDCRMPSWTTVDLGYTYSGFKNTNIAFSVKNVFDSKAPYDPSDGEGTNPSGYNSSMHNILGRYFGLSVSYKFR